MPPARTRPAPSARDRILATACDLFYSRGLRAVGVDTLIAESGVAKATFYKHFPAKDDLILAYLDAMDQQRTDALHSAAEAAGPKPADQLVGAFEALPGIVGARGYRGCPFINAAAESPPGTRIHERAARHRADREAWFADLAEVGGAADPDDVARSLSVLMDGALAGGAVNPGDTAVADSALEQARRQVKRGLKGAPKPAGGKKK